MLNILLLSLSRHYTVDGQYIPSLFIEPEVRHNKTSYLIVISPIIHKLLKNLDVGGVNGNRFVII